MSLSRSAGLLLHPTSLPGPGGIGTIGQHARRFVDTLVASGMHLWQTLPLSPTGYADSPYAGLSAFAGNPMLIALEPLVERGWLTPEDLAEEARQQQIGSLESVRWAVLEPDGKISFITE